MWLLVVDVCVSYGGGFTIYFAFHRGAAHLFWLCAITPPVCSGYILHTQRTTTNIDTHMFAIGIGCVHIFVALTSCNVWT